MIPIVKRILPTRFRRLLRGWQMTLVAWHRRWNFRTPFGRAALGVFGDPRPISSCFGFDRGTPIDRRYIEEFLRRFQSDITGRVLEIGDRTYTRRYGGDRVVASEVLHVQPGNPEATLVGNLESGEGIPSGSFHCIILTQTLHCISNPEAAIRVIRKALIPGGVALMTIPCISPVSRYDAERWGDYWRLTPQGGARIFAHAFLPDELTILEYGNRTTSAAFLFGLAAEDLADRLFRISDPDCPMLLGIRACKSREA